MSLVIVCPEALRTEGNNLAAVALGSASQLPTFNQAPRVQKDGLQYRWTSLVDKDDAVKAKGREPFPEVAGADAKAAQALFDDALILRPEDMVEGFVAPDISNRVVIALDMEPSTVLAALQLEPISEE